jgi:ketosteroid isomerase-like protein
MSSWYVHGSAVALTTALVLASCARPASYTNQETHMQATLGALAQAARPDSRDRAAITMAIEAITRGADLHQWETVRAAFADEVELDYGTPERLSPDTIVVGRWQPLLEGFDATQHVVRDIQVQIDGDRATATSRLQATHFLKGAEGGDVWILTGRYEHSLVRTASGWKVTRMRMIPEASRGNTSLADRARARGARSTTAGRALRDRNRDAVRSFFRQLEAMDTGDAFVALFTEDAKQLMPFAPQGFPRVLDGREAIRRQYAGLPTAYTYMRFPDLLIRDLASANEFFVTYKGDIGLASGGRYANDYAGYFVVRDGRIAEFHEFFNPIVLRQAFGERLGETFNVKP